MQTEQSRLALKRANEIRLHIAVLKKQLAVGDCWWPDEVWEPVSVYELVLAELDRLEAERGGP